MSRKHPKPAQTDDDRLDEALEETFPASDPVSVEPVDGPAPPKQTPSKHDKS